jgi:hypothetical protein
MGLGSTGVDATLPAGEVGFWSEVERFAIVRERIHRLNNCIVLGKGLQSELENKLKSEG